MALYRTRALVIGRRDLGESDRLVEFYSRDFGKVRGVARSARRMRSRFGSALEPFTLGDLVFFDTGRSDLVRIDQFDIAHSFVLIREDLDRLGRGAWVAESVARLSADRDPHPALFDLVVQSLRALEGPTASGRVAISFAVRAVHLLGHRPRLDRCVGCGRTRRLPAPFLLDMTAGGLVCAACPPAPDALPLSPSAVGAWQRLHGLSWRDGLRLPMGPDLARELVGVLEGVMVRLMGRIPQSARFMAQTRRGLAAVGEVPSP